MFYSNVIIEVREGKKNYDIIYPTQVLGFNDYGVLIFLTELELYEEFKKDMDNNKAYVTKKELTEFLTKDRDEFLLVSTYWFKNIFVHSLYGLVCNIPLVYNKKDVTKSNNIFESYEEAFIFLLEQVLIKYNKDKDNRGLKEFVNRHRNDYIKYMPEKLI